MNLLVLEVTFILGIGSILNFSIAASIGNIGDNHNNDYDNIRGDRGILKIDDSYDISVIALDDKAYLASQPETNDADKANQQIFVEMNTMVKKINSQNEEKIKDIDFNEINRVLNSRVKYDDLKDDLNSAVYHDTSYDTSKSNFDAFAMWKASRLFILTFLIILAIVRLVFVCRYYNASKEINKTVTVNLEIPNTKGLQNDGSPVYQKLSENLTGPITPIFNRHEFVFNKPAGVIY